jgi:hypothetical protein
MPHHGHIRRSLDIETQRDIPLRTRTPNLYTAAAIAVDNINIRVAKLITKPRGEYDIRGFSMINETPTARCLRAMVGGNQ